MEVLTRNPRPPLSPSPPKPHHHYPRTLPHLKQIHAHLLRTSTSLPSPFLSHLLFLPLPSLDYALAVFIHAPNPATHLSNRLLRRLAAAGDPRRPLRLYARMRLAGANPDRFSLPALLRAAARAGGRDGDAATADAHALAAKTGALADPFVQTALVGVYSACGRSEDARRVFDGMTDRDLVAWGVMLDGYCQAGRYIDVLLLFDEMKDSGVVPDPVILTTILSACGRTGNLASGKAIHSYIAQSNIVVDAHLQSALINMYSNCGSMDIAQRLFDELSPQNLVVSTAMVFGYAKLGKIDIARSIFDRMDDKDLVSWSAMISGYTESNRPNEALKLFSKMQASGEIPDKITMLSVISACAHLGALDQAKWIHVFVDKNRFRGILSINNALVDMYSKCGSLRSAWEVFDAMPHRNVITWTSMITGFAMHGDGRSAVELFDRMKKEKVEPNGVTFVGLLYACSHAGLVEEGREIFKSMVCEHKIEPKLEHYGCMVDILGRAKLLREALQLIESMPFRPNVVVWGSLLGSCKLHNDVELGELAAKRLLELDPDHNGAYVLLSNIYAKANRWESVREVRRLMKCRGVLKEKGCSWIELKGDVYEFLTGDESHPNSRDIYHKLDEVARQLEVMGYAPDAGSVLVDIEEEEKRVNLLLHSEKLALSLGLINSERGSCIRITKNLRVCEDCHSFMKLVSKAFEIEIVLRDRTRFHHFISGVCSCRDFW